MNGQHYLRRKDAADYLKGKYGCGSWRTLAKLAVTGDGPIFRKFGRLVLYAPEDLDQWAKSKLGPKQHSTSQQSKPDVAHINAKVCEIDTGVVTNQSNQKNSNSDPVVSTKGAGNA